MGEKVGGKRSFPGLFTVLFAMFKTELQNL